VLPQPSSSLADARPQIFFLPGEGTLKGVVVLTYALAGFRQRQTIEIS
jgi:hypothetical protein